MIDIRMSMVASLAFWSVSRSYPILEWHNIINTLLSHRCRIPLALDSLHLIFVFPDFGDGKILFASVRMTTLCTLLNDLVSSDTVPPSLLLKSLPKRPPLLLNILARLIHLGFC